MIRHVVTLVLAIGFVRGPGCGSADSVSVGLNAPCTRDKDCKGGLVCEKGVCVGSWPGPPDDASTDAPDGDADGGLDGALDADEAGTTSGRPSGDRG